MVRAREGCQMRWCWPRQWRSPGAEEARGLLVREQPATALNGCSDQDWDPDSGADTIDHWVGRVLWSSTGLKWSKGRQGGRHVVLEKQRAEADADAQVGSMEEAEAGVGVEMEPKLKLKVEVVPEMVQSAGPEEHMVQCSDPSWNLSEPG